MVGLSCLHKRTCKNAQRDAGVTALRVHRSLQPRQRSSSKPSVTICRDVPYATKPRTVMDIYVPSQTFHPPTSTTQQAIQNTAKTSGHHVSEQGVAESKQLPVALFCHGGVWATGVPHPKFYPPPPRCNSLTCTSLECAHKTSVHNATFADACLLALFDNLLPAKAPMTLSVQA